MRKKATPSPSSGPVPTVAAATEARNKGPDRKVGAFLIPAGKPSRSPQSPRSACRAARKACPYSPTRRGPARNGRPPCRPAGRALVCAGTAQSRVSAIRLRSLTRECRQGVSHAMSNSANERVFNGLIGLGDPLIALDTLPQNHSIPQAFSSRTWPCAVRLWEDAPCRA